VRYSRTSSQKFFGYIRLIVKKIKFNYKIEIENSRLEQKCFINMMPAEMKIHVHRYRRITNGDGHWIIS
jgi:hypothetical protein